MKPDFSGYATKNNLVCSDGLVIREDAFKQDDGVRIPLVWKHNTNDQSNILGHGILENRTDGVYVYGFFNDSEKGQLSKVQVEHGDLDSLSISAGKLIKRGIDVISGKIREVSLVPVGANPGAKIDNVYLRHGDFIEEVDNEAIITTGESLVHSSSEEGEEMTVGQNDESEVSHEGETVQDVVNTMTDKQINVMNAVTDMAVAEAIKELNSKNDSDDDDKDEDKVTISQSSESEDEDLTHQEGPTVANVFEKKKSESTLQHEEGVSEFLEHLDEVFADAKKNGSMKESVLEHAGSYGIDNIEVLFPDAVTVNSSPDVIGRRVEWVADILTGTKHTPFSRIRSTAVDLTADEARAKGYVKGALKKDEVIKLLKRVTTPTTIYKKQKLDRDDIVDITELDVVAFLKAEMRYMLDEEIARAVLIGDGREADDPDKIDEDSIRPVAYDNEMYAHQVNLPTGTKGEALVEAVIRSRKNYKGTGTPNFYTTDDVLTDMLLIKNKIGQRTYSNVSELSAVLRVKEIIPVEVMEDAPDILGIMLNPADYTIGADKGGKIAMFDDFDIDYNQEKYLIETRISGALTKPKSAVVLKRASGNTVVPIAPTFDQETNTITIPTITGVAYYNVTEVLGDGTLMTAGDHVIAVTTDVEARPTAGYNFPHNTDDDWTFAFVA